MEFQPVVLFLIEIYIAFFIFREKLFPETTVRNIIYQILQGLAFMHKTGKNNLNQEYFVHNIYYNIL